MATKFKIYVVRPVRDCIVYGLLHSIIVLSRFLPRKFLLAWHGFAARGFYMFMGRTRRIIERNLELVYGPEKHQKQYYKFGRQVFVSLAKTFTDYAIFGKKKTPEQFAKYFKIKGEDNLRNAYKQGKGVICLVPHTHGWEFSAIMPPVLGYRTTGVSSRIKNMALDKLMVGLRESRGMHNVVRHHCYDTLVDRLKSGECLIMMIDHDSKSIKGEFLQFFGHRAYTPIGCARLVMDTGALVVPMYTIRDNETDTYTFEIMPEVPFVQKADKDETARYNTQVYNDIIESVVRKYPEQWVWMQERWKTTPEILKWYLDAKAAERKQLEIENKKSGKVKEEKWYNY